MEVVFEGSTDAFDGLGGVRRAFKRAILADKSAKSVSNSLVGRFVSNEEGFSSDLKTAGKSFSSDEVDGLATGLVLLDR